MKKRKARKSIIVILFAVVAVAALFYLFNKQVANAPEPSSPAVTPQLETTEDPIDNELSWPLDKTIDAKVLMYHHIGPLPENSDPTRTGLTVSAERFESQMKYLKDNNYNVITLAAMYEQIAKGQLPENSVVLTFDDGYADNYAYAWPIMQKYDLRGTFFIISSYLGGADTMTNANVLDLFKNGNEIGSHTKTHPSLEKQTPAKTEAELVGSKEALEKIIGIKVTSLCYPAGKYNNDTIQIAKTAGYRIAVTTKAGKPFSTNNPFEVPRYRMNPDTDISKVLK